MDVSKNFDRWLQVLYKDRLCLEDEGNLIHKLKNLFLLDVEWLHWSDRALTSLRLEQIFDKERIESLVMVLLDQWGLDVGAELFGLLLELIN